MPGLGIGLAAVTRESFIPANIATVMGGVKYMWEITGGSGNLQPLAAGSGVDNDTWDLDGTDYMPAAVGAVAAEGYFDLDGSSDIQPLDV